MAFPKPLGKGKTEDIKLDSAASHILEECRMVLPGIQALFGFQLIAVFNEGFGEKLSHAEQLVHLVAIVLTVLSMALVMTPAALHRQAEPQQVSERFVWLASNMVLAGMFPLAIAVGLDAYIVASIVAKNDAFAAILAIAVMLLFAALWLFVPWRESRRHRSPARR
jgi:predicted lysophospholipase L1 biosynthesis ABC-type transport system permease subunit